MIKEKQNNKEKKDFRKAVKVVNKLNPLQKSKHNFWINGLEKGSNFFHYIYMLGKGIFYVIVFITCLLFWSNTYFNNLESGYLAFSNMALVMLYIFRLCMYLIVGGLLFKYFCLFLSLFLNKKEEDVILKEGVKKYVNSK